MKKWFVVLFSLSLIPTAYAAPVLDRVVVSNGGSRASQGNLVMEMTIGQSISSLTTNNTVKLGYGFWWSVQTVNVGVDEWHQSLVYSMRQNAPNPFTTNTSIDYVIPQGKQVPVFIGIYDLNGRLVKTLVREAKTTGSYKAVWSGESDSGSLTGAGVYFVKIQVESFTATRKVVMLK